MGKINKTERKVLTFLAERHMEDFGFFPFAPICRKTRLKREVVRRACRSLARKGFTAFASGLCTEDGDFAGSGYACTDAGREALKAEAN